MSELTQEKCDLIESYFAQYGWTYDRADDMGLWYTGFRGDVANFNMSIKAGPRWIYFTVNPFVVAPQDAQLESRLHEHLLHLNINIGTGKFCLNQGGDIILTIDLPFISIDSLQYTEFAEALNLVCHYCDKNYVEILNLSTQPNAPSQFMDTQGDVDLG